VFDFIPLHLQRVYSGILVLVETANILETAHAPLAPPNASTMQCE
jgi:hypothetical protein